MKKPEIKPVADIPSTYKQGELTATPAEVAALLGFAPNVEPCDKTDHEYAFTADGKPCACWRYRGASVFSTWGPSEVWASLFGSQFHTYRP